jgi:RNA polymerase sigma-70 factor, ECF subfamily
MRAMSSSPDFCSDSSTSSSLIRRAQQHDPDAWQRLVDLYGPLVFYWCRRKGQLSSAEASDVFQEVFVAVNGALPRFALGEARQTFRGWLWTITRNKIRDHYRRWKNEPRAVGGTDAGRRLAEIPETWDVASADPADRAEMGSLFQRALDLVRDQFAERTWQAFWQSAVEGRPTAEIARELGLSENSVRQAKSRVLRRLRQELGDWAE